MKIMKRIIFTLCMMFGFTASSVLPMAPAQVQERDCSVCLNPVAVDRFRQLACGHNQTCDDCFSDVVRGAIRAGVFGRIRCSQQGCEHRLTQAEVYQLIPEIDLRNTYNRLRIQTNPNGRFCPGANCNHGYIYNPAPGPQELECQECHSRYCNNCLVQHPRGAACRRDVAAQAAVRGNRNVRACPQCAVVIYREAGCNQVRCNCGHAFCWMCLAPDPYHAHINCLPADLARVRRLYDDQNGQANAGGFGFAVPEAAPAFVWNQPARPAVGPRPIPNYPYGFYDPYNQPYEPVAAPAWNPPAPPRKNNAFLYFIGGIAIATGVTYIAYKLYAYLKTPKQTQLPDLKTNLDNLHKVAIYSRARLTSSEGYVHGTFKNYFVAYDAAKAYKDLDVASMTQLKTIVNDLEAGLCAGNCDKQYAALVNFIIVQDKAEVVVPVKSVEAKKPAAQVKPVVAEQSRARNKRPIKKRKQAIQKPKR